MHWKEMWERYASMEHEKYSAMNGFELLELVRTGRWGEYYQLWHSLPGRVSVSDAVPVLLKVLHTDCDYLYRYHAAAALIEICGLKEFRPADLSADHEGLDKNLRKLSALLPEIPAELAT